MESLRSVNVYNIERLFNPDQGWVLEANDDDSAMAKKPSEARRFINPAVKGMMAE